MMQERAVRTRRLLVEHAAGAFTRAGYEGASISGIARAAEVSTGALHFHFPTKASLSDAVRETGVPGLRRLVLRLGARGGEPLQQLIDLSQLVLEWLARDATVRAAVRMHQALPAAPPGGADFCATWLEEMRLLSALAVRDGQLLPGLLPVQVDTVVAAVTAGSELLAGPRGRCRSVPEVAEAWRLILPGVVGESAADRFNVYGTLHLEGAAPTLAARANRGAPSFRFGVPASTLHG